MSKNISEQNYAPHISLILVQILFGTFPVVGKFVLQTFPALGIVAFRICGAAVLLYLAQRFRGKLKLERKSDYARYAFFSLLGVVLNQVLYVSGLSLTTATNTALNSFFYAWYVAISRDTFARNGALRSIVWILIFGAAMSLPFGFYAMQGVDFAAVQWQTWAAMAFIIVFPTAGAYFFNAWAMARVQPSTVVVYVYLQPLIGTFLAITLLGEEWKSRILVAMILIFAGVFLVTRKRKVVTEAL
jgi:drug/metabolite transporter (DMT)-like permease